MKAFRFADRLRPGGKVLGVFRPALAPGAGRLVPTDRRQKAEWSIPAGNTLDAQAGDVVLAEPLPLRGYGLKPARVVERLGRLGDARSASLICLFAHDIPFEFAPEAIAEAAAAGPVALSGRTDLRQLGLVTIDGEDARDFDDAVFAEMRPEGWRILVAIADVAHYVAPGSALDAQAALRGNAVYFPDRVVPMLPEALSNGWCSLLPGEDRGCLFADMTIDAQGELLTAYFGRGLMRSAARLTYTALQQAHESGTALPGLPQALPDALYGAYRALSAARLRRGTLDLDLPERQLLLDDAGRVQAIRQRPRLHAHRLIEAFMVQANVAAAQTLRRLRQPCMARIHPPPSPEKRAALRRFLATLGLSLQPAGALRTRDLDAILQQVAATEQAPMVNEMVLRCQSPAAYSPDMIGHFGQGLADYAHFTSPIRRYADLLVHRALIAGLGLGADGLRAEDAGGLRRQAVHITHTERRAALAERDAMERIIAAQMADKIGALFAARISGVTRFGVFVTLIESGAAGLVPLSNLLDDVWMHDEARHALTGKRSHISYHLTQAVQVRLTDAAPITGALVFAIDAEPCLAAALASLASAPASLAPAAQRLERPRPR